MKHIVSLLLFGFLLAATASQARAVGDDMTAAGPLVIIRYNQDRVYYQHALYQAVSRAVEVKPDAAFDIFAVSPVTNDAAMNQRLQTASTAKAQDVLAALERMGIPAQRLSLQSRQSDTAKSSEVHIFVH